ITRYRCTNGQQCQRQLAVPQPGFQFAKLAENAANDLVRRLILSLQLRVVRSSCNFTYHEVRGELLHRLNNERLSLIGNDNLGESMTGNELGNENLENFVVVGHM